MDESFKSASRTLMALRRSMENYAAGGSTARLQTVRSEIDALLGQLETQLTALAPVLNKNLRIDTTTAEHTVRDLDSFVSFEINIAKLDVRSSTELRKFVAMARAAIHSENHLAIGVNADGADPTKTIYRLVREQTIVAITTIDSARATSRKVKKSAKNTNLFRYSLGALGAAMAVVDVGASIGSAGMAAPVAITSMTLGVYAVGSLAHNDPTLLKGALKNRAPAKAKTKGKAKKREP